MEDKHTPGPWFADKDGRIWRRHPSELYQNGGGVAGDRPIAFTNRGWTDEGLAGYPLDANTQLISVAPEMYEALKLALKALESISDEMTLGERYTNAGQYLIESLTPVREVIAKVEGKR